MRLHKEGWETFVITGSENKNYKKPFGVFEEYHFNYDSVSIRYIMDSIHGDVVIFTGSQDTRFTWKNEQADSVKYIAALTNSLIAAKESNVRKFVYISEINQALLQQKYINNLQENSIEIENNTLDISMELQKTENTSKDKSRKKSYKDIVFSQAEVICQRYKNDAAFNIIMLRMGETYGYNGNVVNNDNFCTQLLKAYIKNKSMKLTANRSHYFININDATEAVYRILESQTYNDNYIYNVITEEVIKEQQVLDLLNKLSGNDFPVEYMENDIEIPYKATNALIVKEYGYRTKYTFDEGFTLFYKWFISHGDLFGEKVLKKPNLLDLLKIPAYVWKVLKPFLETAVAFLFVQFIVYSTMGNSYFNGIDFYLIYAVFIAILYGKQQTICATIYSVIGRMILYSTSKNVYEFMINYETYIWLLQLILISMSVAFMRDKFKYKLSNLDEESKFLEAELGDIKNINYSNVEIKDTYEKRLLNYRDSLARIHEITSRLDDLEPEKVLFEAVGTISSIMGSKDIAIYICSKDNRFCRLAASSSQLSRSMGKSVEIDKLKNIFELLETGMIYVNKKMEKGYPLMAGAIYSKDKLESIIMIWTLDMELTNLYEVNLFAILCNLISRSMDRAYKYMQSNEFLRYIPGTKVLQAEAFNKVLELQNYGSQKQLTEYSLIRIDAKNMDRDSILKRVNGIIRETDYIGVDKNNRVYLLLTNTDKENAKFAIDRFDKKVNSKNKVSANTENKVNMETKNQMIGEGNELDKTTNEQIITFQIVS